MRIACLSDTHGLLPPVEAFEGADLVLHAGDIGPDRNVQRFINEELWPWVRAVRNQDIPVWLTLGNHDNPFEYSIHPDLPIITDDVVVVGSYKIWLSPWSPQFGNWHWMTDESRLSDLYRRIPQDCDIIVSHTPPYQMCDQNVGGEHCGSKALRVRLRELSRAKRELDGWPIVVCGHIHEAKGYKSSEFAHVYNVTSLDEYYQPRTEMVTWIEI